MRIDANKDLQQKVSEIFEKVEDKNEAMFQAIEAIVTEKTKEITQQVVSEANAGVRNGFRQLTNNEVAFYESLKKGPREFRQDMNQADIIPTEIIDYTLEGVKKPSGVRKLIKLTPPGVKKWLFGTKTGGAVWGKLTDAILGEITGEISSASMDVFKLNAFVVIPKAIRDLEIGYVDKYFTAVLNEAMEDGVVAGYLYGDGVTAPIGIAKQIGAVGVDGTHTAKTKINTVTKLSPKGLAPVLATLTNGGLRKVEKLYLICNPLDEANYVNPALYGESPVAGFVDKSFMPIEVIADANVTQGDGFFTLDAVYTMGFQGVKVDEYKETKALDDADLVIAKVYANGRAVDDNAAVYFDVTALEEFVPTYKAE